MTLIAAAAPDLIRNPTVPQILELQRFSKSTVQFGPSYLSHGFVYISVLF